MDHVICHLKPSIDASPMAYNAEMMSTYDDVVVTESDAVNAEDTQTSCQWCCHTFECPSVGIPTRKNVEGTYTVTGQFCSASCAAAYIFDQHADSNTAWTRYQMLNDMTGSNGPVVRAPPRNALRLFGGTMNIEEFRSGATTVVMRQPPTMVEQTRLEEIPSGYLYRDLYKPLDEERVSEYKQRLNRAKPKSAFYFPTESAPSNV